MKNIAITAKPKLFKTVKLLGIESYDYYHMTCVQILMGLELIFK